MIGKMRATVIGGPCTRECPMPEGADEAAWIHPTAERVWGGWWCPNCGRTWDTEPRRGDPTLPGGRVPPA
jgi:hypothetical protein